MLPAFQADSKEVWTEYLYPQFYCLETLRMILIVSQTVWGLVCWSVGYKCKNLIIFKNNICGKNICMDWFEFYILHFGLIDTIQLKYSF